MTGGQHPSAEEIIRYGDLVCPQPADRHHLQDGDDMMLGDAVQGGLADSVRDNDAKFPPDFRLSKSGRAKKE